MSRTTTEFTNEAIVNKANSIMRIRGDYNSPWIGLLRETTQNSTDGWCFNKSQGNLSEEQELVIQFIINTSDDTLTIKDNAGGMNLDTFKDNLLAIDNPSDDKADGNGAGSYGRGFWVIMSSGEVADIETHHETGMYTSTVNVEGKYTDIVELEEPELGDGQKGTFYKIHDVREEDMKYLSDWERVEETLIENFVPLLNDDNITIEYTIDGETRTPDAPDLNELREEYELHTEEELPPFTYHDEEYRVKDFTMVDATKMDEEPPWKGIVLFKGNEYLDYPFMKVDYYYPQGVPSANNPVKMFGWCDASDLCRPREDGSTLENNAHNDIQIDPIGSRANIQNIVYDIHDEHFKNDYTTDEKQDLLDNVVSEVNDLLSNFDSSFEDFSKMAGNGVGTGPSTLSSPSSSNLPFLRCKTDKYKVETDEEIHLGIEINPRDNIEYNTYELFNITVDNTTEDETVNEIDNVEFEVQENKPIETVLDIVSFDENGKYKFSAEIRGLNTDDVVDTATTRFIVGEIEEEKPEEKEPDDKDSEGSVQFVSAMSTFANEDAERAYVRPLPEGGMELNVNTEWPTLIEAKETLRGDEFEQRQHELFSEWGTDAVIKKWMRDKVEELGVDSETKAAFERTIEMREGIDKNKVSRDE